MTDLNNTTFFLSKGEDGKWKLVALAEFPQEDLEETLEYFIRALEGELKFHRTFRKPAR